MRLLPCHTEALSAAALLLGASIASADTAAEVLEIEKATNQSLLWGPYRPNLYFGVRPRIPKSLMTGLIWARVDSYEGFQTDMRHTCEQHELDGYGWDEYDVRNGGRQTIHDPGNKIDMTTEFVKIPGGEHGGNWGVRIKGTPQEDAPPDLKTTVVFYVLNQGLGHNTVLNENDPRGFDGPIHIEGESTGLGDYKIEVTEGPDSNAHPLHSHPSYAQQPLDKTFVRTLQMPDDVLWQAKPVLFSSIKGHVDKLIEEYTPENMPPPAQLYTIDNGGGMGNIHLIQKVFEGPFEFDILYSSGSAPDRMTSESLTKGVKTATDTFSARFVEAHRPQPPFLKERYEEFSKYLFSNLMGGIGYFYGDSKTDRSYDQSYEEENEGFWEEATEAQQRHQGQTSADPQELFTSIPSRPFFPRGFLWDEGFHLLPIIDYDVDLSLDIIKSWFNLMDDDGWIGREQILGAEARSKVPAEFQVQYPHYANPPTLFFALHAFLDKLEDPDVKKAAAGKATYVPGQEYAKRLVNHDVATSYLRELYPLLKRHYFWFRRTQSGDIKSYDREAFSTKEAYRWRGRTPKHILTSGLDDYPRAQPPHPGELHVDLMSWMGMMTKAMNRIAKFLGETEDASEFERYDTAILRNLDDLHWDEEEKTFCDATIDDYEEDVHVCHKGYISIFPFMVGLLPPDSPHLKPILDLIANPEELWSDFGIRSLSKSSEFYGTEENYWRSPIWINMNYLVVKELLNLAQTKGPHQERASKIYTDLRKNLVETVYNSWLETGFAWEQYNPETGKGQRTQHFTGWTSLITKIMAMPDLTGGKAHIIDEL